MAQQMIGRSLPIVERETGNFDFDLHGDVEQTILEIGSRHPLRLDQVAEIERAHRVSGVADKMLHEGALVQTTYAGETYLLPGHFLRGEKEGKKKGGDDDGSRDGKRS
jgi:hypothetical protein